MKKAIARSFKAILKRLIRLSLIVAIFMLGYVTHRMLQPETPPARVRGWRGFDWPAPESRALCTQLLPFQQLLEALPAQLDGWTSREPPYGTCFTHQDYAYTMARRDWTRGESVLEIKIMDARHAPQVLASLKEASRFNEEDTLHYRHGLTSEHYQGFEAYYYKERRGEIQLAVFNRLWISIEGYELEGPDVLRNALNRIGFKRLRRFLEQSP